MGYFCLGKHLFVTLFVPALSELSSLECHEIVAWQEEATEPRLSYFKLLSLTGSEGERACWELGMGEGMVGAATRAQIPRQTWLYLVGAQVASSDCPTAVLVLNWFSYWASLVIGHTLLSIPRPSSSSFLLPARETRDNNKPPSRQHSFSTNFMSSNWIDILEEPS